MIICRGRTLILKRAAKVRVNPSLWSPISGRVDSKLPPARQAWKEIVEEAGMDRQKLRMVRVGRKYKLQVSELVEVTVYPYLFESMTRRVQLNWENTDYRWVRISDLSRFKLIPKFDLTLRALELL
jgi:isopentenyldiphosphate isomerase